MGVHPGNVFQSWMEEALEGCGIRTLGALKRKCDLDHITFRDHPVGKEGGGGGM